MKKDYYKFIYFVLLNFVTLTFLAQSASVFDANYFNKDNASPPIKIGKGFHVNDIYKQTRACFTPETSSPKKLTPQQTGGKKTSIRLFYTKTNEEFNDFKTKGVSGKVSFLNLFTLSGQKLEEYSNKTIHDEERIIFNANVDFGVYSFDTEPTLTLEAKQLVEQKKVADFIKYHGTHYISGIRKESNISVVLTKTKLKDESTENSTSGIQASGKIPYRGSGSLEIDNGSWANKQLEEYEFSVSVEINGPAIEQSSIQGQITSIINGNQQDKALAIASIIESAIKNISDPNQSLITQYYYSPFDLYGVDGIYWDDKKINQLTKINEAVVNVYSAKSQLNELITESGKVQIEKELRDNKVPQNYINKITDKYNEILPNLNALYATSEKYLTELETKYIACSDINCPSNTTCCSNESYIAEIQNYNLNKKIENELNKVMTVAEDAVTEINKPSCEKNKKGIITIKNLSSNPYSLYQGEKFVTTLAGKSIQTYEVNMGTYYFKAVQNSGYVMYPTENKRTANISRICQEVILQVGFED